jgi:hypothetical protein
LNTIFSVTFRQSVQRRENAFGEPFIAKHLDGHIRVLDDVVQNTGDSLFRSVESQHHPQRMKDVRLASQQPGVSTAAVAMLTAPTPTCCGAGSMSWLSLCRLGECQRQCCWLHLAADAAAVRAAGAER